MSLPAWIPIFGPLSDRRRAWRELPLLAARLGLRFVESEQRHQLGRIDGTLDGYPVVVSPDVPNVTVHFARELDDFTLNMLDLGNKRRDHGLGHPKFARRFPTVELSPPQVEALRARPDVLDRLLALLRHRVCGIIVTQTGLVCAMYNPYRFSAKNLHYIRAADLERLLPEMIETVRLLESTLPGKQAFADGGRPSPVNGMG